MGLFCLVLVLMLHLSWSSSSSVPPPSSHLCPPDQRAALLHFKNSIFLTEFCGDDYPKTETWNKRSTDCCSWEGVECDNLTGNVIGIDLSHSCITGPLFESANDSLFRLHSLRSVDLNFNELNGSLTGLFHLHGLQRLNLAYNSFYGAIPSELFSELVSLTHLNLSLSGFSGLIPNQISLLSSSVLIVLSSYSSSNLTFDGRSFDMLARNLTKLRNLVLDSVDMSDVALTSLLNLSPSLEHLSLFHCDLHGEFPTQVFQLLNLKHIDLGVNQNLRGHLPKTNWSSGLELLDLSNCGGFRGSIPPSLGNLTRIISIDLSGNRFEGQIPDVFGNLRKLDSLRFSRCNLSGPLPITMFNLPKMNSLNLSYNHLEGPLPNHVSELQLPSLIQLDLSHNELASPIDRIQMPSSVQYVDLSSNDFDGPFPRSIFDLVNLTYLCLSSNNLSGVIKSDKLSKLRSLEFLDLSNNSLLSLSTSGNDVVR